MPILNAIAFFNLDDVGDFANFSMKGRTYRNMTIADCVEIEQSDEKFSRSRTCKKNQDSKRRVHLPARANEQDLM